MLLQSKLFFFILSFFLQMQTAMKNEISYYQEFAQPYALQWHKNCIEQLSAQEILTITKVLLLSYQIVEASVTMYQSRLTIQQELLKINTLSLNDTIDGCLQATRNNLTPIKQAVDSIEHAQYQIQTSYEAFKNFGPDLIEIDPCVIQIFIAQLKDLILEWIKSEQPIIDQLYCATEQLQDAQSKIPELQSLLDMVQNLTPSEHGYLLLGTNAITELYSTIEMSIANITTFRQEKMMHFGQLLTAYFQSHYTILHGYLITYDNYKHLHQLTLHNFPKSAQQTLCLL